MSEKRFILLADISLSQAKVESIVKTSATDAVISPLPLGAPEEKAVRGGGEGSPLDVCSNQLKKVMCVRQPRVRRWAWRTRTLIMLVVCCIWESLGTNPRCSLCQRSFAGKDSPESLCPRVLLTTLIFRNVSFQIFNVSSNHSTRNLLLASY